jgi:uncharacterized protein YjbI with pentapeptide repeats
MAKSVLTTFEALANRLAQTVTPIEPSAFSDEEAICLALAANMKIDRHPPRLDITDSIIERTRFTAATIVGSAFDRVIIRACDLSGVTFVNCLFRECLVVGSKSSAHLAFIDCNHDNVLIGQTRLERLEFHNSKIGTAALFDVTLQHLRFQDCKRYKHRGEVTLTDVELGGATGLGTLRSCGVQVKMDAALWRELSDSMMHEKGFEEIGESPAREASQQFTRLANSLEI